MIIRSSIFSVHMNVWMLDIHKRRSVLNINENLTEKSTRGFKKKSEIEETEGGRGEEKMESCSGYTEPAGDTQ